MKLLNEITELSTSNDTALSVVLRKLLVLSYELKNDRLANWASAELDGYDNGQDVPDYRLIRSGARGTFSGPFNAGIKNMSLPSLNLAREHRHWAEEVRVGQGIAAIEASAAANGGRRPWPADLISLYQQSFIQGYALVEAWQDMPGSVFVGILATVRNRALRFALELRRELGQADDDITTIPPAKVDQNVTNYIYGGNNVIGGTSHRFNQVGTISVGKGDTVALTAALSSLGFTVPEISELHQAATQDQAEAAPGIGRRVTGWLAKIGTAVGTAGLSVAADVAKTEATSAILGYLGLK